MSIEKDIRNACVYLPSDHFMFKFDLKSGYHHIDILQDHQTFLGFSWVVNGVRKFFVSQYSLLGSPQLLIFSLRLFVFSSDIGEVML